MKEFWNQRYNQTDYVYGEQTNAFFKESIDKLKAGRILLPAEGKGRNAVYAAAEVGKWKLSTLLLLSIPTLLRISGHLSIPACFLI